MAFKVHMITYADEESRCLAKFRKMVEKHDTEVALLSVPA
jgi:hypothetical protein